MTVNLSPYGSSALVPGSLRKGVPMMLLGGVLAWVSAESWTLERGSLEVFPLLMAYGTLVAIAVPAQLVAGPRAMSWLMASAGAAGITVPWFFALAVRQQGQGLLWPTLIVLVSSWLVTYAVCRVTRRIAWPRPAGKRGG